MGSFCIILGVVLFLSISGGGYLLSAKIANYSIMGQPLTAFMSLPKAFTLYIMIAFGLVGLVVGLSFCMIGINSNKISALKKKIRSLESASKKKSKKTSKKTDFEEAEDNMNA